MVMNAKGVTLIELMVVIVILSILALLGIPLTQSWIHGAQVVESQGMLLQGYDQARAVAMRNPTGVTGSDSAAGLKLVDGANLLVCRGAPSGSGCSAGGSAVTWAADLSLGKNVGTVIGGNADASISLTNQGVPVGNPPTYSVSKGSETIEGSLGGEPE